MRSRTIRFVSAGIGVIALALLDMDTPPACGVFRGSSCRAAAPIDAVASAQSPLYRSFPECKYLFDDMEDVHAWEGEVSPWRQQIEKMGRTEIGAGKRLPSKYNARLCRLPIAITWDEGVEGNVWEPWVRLSPDQAKLLEGHAQEGTVTARVALGTLGFQGQRDQVVFLDLRLEAAGQSLPLFNRILGEFEFKGREPGNRGVLSSVALSGNGRQVLIAGGGGLGAALFDAQTGELLHKFPGSTAGTIPAILSADGRRVLVERTLWNAQNGQRLREFTANANSPIISAALSADGGLALTLTGAEDRSATVWDAETGREVLNVKGSGSLHGPVGRTALSSDGQRALTGHWNNTVALWNTKTGGVIHTFEQRGAGSPEHATWGSSAALSSDGRFAVISAPDSTAVLWNAETGTKLHTLRGKAWRCKVAMTSDGDRILTGAGSSREILPGEVSDSDRLTDETATLWDAHKGTPVLSLCRLKGPLREVAISADGRRALTSSAKMTAILWDLEY